MGTWRTVWEGQLSIANFLLNFLDFLPCDYIMYSKNKYNYKKNSHTRGLGSSSGKGTCPKPGTCPSVSWSPGERYADPLRMASAGHAPWGCHGEFLLERKLTPRDIFGTTLEHLNLPCLALFGHISLVCFKNP